MRVSSIDALIHFSLLLDTERDDPLHATFTALVECSINCCKLRSWLPTSAFQVHFGVWVRRQNALERRWYFCEKGSVVFGNVGLSFLCFCHDVLAPRSSICCFFLVSRRQHSTQSVSDACWSTCDTYGRALCTSGGRPTTRKVSAGSSNTTFNLCSASCKFHGQPTSCFSQATHY